jgi:hypothetical protein
MRSLILSALCILCGTASIEAQQVRGRIVGASSGMPVSGAFVVLVDSTRATAAATLTSESGMFSLTAKLPGTYVIRVERLALRAHVTSAIVLAAGAVETKDITVTETAVALAPVNARAERSGCRSFGDLDDETEAVWEEARKALSVIGWTASNAPVRMSIVRSLRERYAGSSRLYFEAHDATLREVRGSPWSSVPANDLMRAGFVRQVNEGYVYYVPDADVLLSDVFLAAHCFRVVGHPDSTNFVGLDFRPRGSPKVTDIAGTLWLNRESAELRSLDYRYVNLPFRMQSERIGGSATYQRLDNGMWILGGWTLVAPRPITLTPTRRDAQQMLMSEHIARVIRATTADGRLLHLAADADAFDNDSGSRPADIPFPGGTMPARLWLAQRCEGPPTEGRLHLVGTVRNETGQPLTAVIEIATAMPGYFQDRTARTDPDGLYFVCNLPGGQPYSIRAGARGYQTAEQKSDRVDVDVVQHRFVLEAR